MNDEDFTPEERKALRKMLRADEAARDRAAQEKAARLTTELRTKHGFLNLE